MFRPAEHHEQPRMPDDPEEGAKWLRDRLLKCLQEAKIWPVKLTSYKHQAELSN